MAFDPRIILGAGVGVQQIDTPLEMEAKRAALGQVRQQAADAKQAREDDAAFRQALQSTGGDWDAAIQQLRTQGRNTLPIEEALTKHRNAVADGIKKHLDAEKTKFDVLGRIIPNVKSQEDWDQWLPVAAQIDPEFVQHVGPRFNAQVFTSLQNMGVDPDKQFEASNKAHESYAKGEPEAGFRNSLLAARDDEDIAGQVQIAKSMGVGEATIRKYVQPGETWSPEWLQRVTDLARPPKEIAEKEKDLIANTTGGLTGDLGLAAAKYMQDHGLTSVLQIPTPVINQMRREAKQAISITNTAAAEKPLTPYQRLNETRQLRNDFNRETQASRTVEQQLGLMRASLAAVKKGAAPAGSQGVLVTFQKILDPTSVVRESEYARSASGLSLMGRLEGSWMKISQGGAGVTPADLEQFVNLAEQFAVNQRKFAEQSRRQINEIAKGAGLNPDLITRDIGEPNEPVVATVPADVNAFLKGKKSGIYTLKDGRKFTVNKDGSVSQ